MTLLDVTERVLGEAVVAIITLNRPERLNAISRDMLDALDHHVGLLSNDGRIRAVIITGAGDRAFSAGADVTSFAGMAPLEAEGLMRHGQKVLQRIEDLPQPVVAAINGYALGGGLELALACDFRIAAATATFGQPEVTLANLPGWGGTQRLPRLIGEAMAKDLILTGRTIGAPEALQLHLVHEITAVSALDAALALAGRLCQFAPAGLALGKRAIHAARTGTDAGYAVESEGVGLCFSTPEQQRAVRRFLNREPDEESGRGGE